MAIEGPCRRRGDTSDSPCRDCQPSGKQRQDGRTPGGRCRRAPARTRRRLPRGHCRRREDAQPITPNRSRIAALHGVALRRFEAFTSYLLPGPWGRRVSSHRRGIGLHRLRVGRATLRYAMAPLHPPDTAKYCRVSQRLVHDSGAGHHDCDPDCCRPYSPCVAS